VEKSDRNRVNESFGLLVTAGFILRQL